MTGPRRSASPATAVPLLFALLLALPPARAWAHDVGLSRGEYTVAGREVRAELVFAAADAPPREPALRVRAGAAECPLAERTTEPTEADGVRVRARFSCDAAPTAIDLAFLAELPAGHAHLARVTGDVALDGAFDRARARIRLREPGGASLLWMGVAHILTGWDHLLFLLGLVVVGGRWRSILAAVTAFTVAHSITLGLAATDVLHVPPRLVEPAIAASVVWVGVENFWAKSAQGRWRITLPFGLVHGLGFAGALRELELPRPRVPMALLSFNAGVELGQLGVLCLVLPLLWALGRSALFRRWGVRAISAAVAAAGAVWFVLRVAG